MADTTASGAGSATHVDDPGFAARIRQRDAQALEEVVRRYLPHILRAAGGAGLSSQLAEDVAQDTFVTFIETAPRYQVWTRDRGSGGRDSGDRPTRQLSCALAACPATSRRSGGGLCFDTVLGAVLANSLPPS